MSQINSSGRFTGLAAQTYGEIDPQGNAWCDAHYAVVSVVGATPEPGYVFAHRLEDGAIVQLPAASRPNEQHQGTYQNVRLTQRCPASGIAPAATLGGLALGEFFRRGANYWRMGRAVTPYGIATTVQPPTIPGVVQPAVYADDGDPNATPPIPPTLISPAVQISPEIVPDPVQVSPQPIAPAEGFAWALFFDTSTVAQLPASTEIESYSDAAPEAWSL